MTITTKRALILANGTPPRKALFKAYFRSADLFICADGGANIAARFKSKPQLIIGDLDSVSKETLRKFRGAEIRHLKKQNSTDLEKALSAAIKKSCRNITVLGATGGRFDHTIGNLSALAKFSRHAKIVFADDTSTLFAAGKKIEFSVPAGTTVSLIPISRCESIVTTGLKWNLKNESLQFGVRESTSNMVVSSPVTIKVGSGNLILFILNKAGDHPSISQ